MRTGLRLGLLLAMATGVLIGLLGAKALPPTRALGIWFVLLTAIALRELVRSVNLRHEPRSAFEKALATRETPRPETPVYEGMERELVLATGSAEHAHRRLVPLLRSAAAARLARRHGIDLERRPDVARTLFDEHTWELVRPDRREPQNRRAPGPQHDEIAAAVGRIEAL